MAKFKFVIGSTVSIGGGNESGKVIGRAEYDYAENSYLVRYIAGDGRCVESWWTESSLS